MKNRKTEFEQWLVDTSKKVVRPPRIGLVLDGNRIRRYDVESLSNNPADEGLINLTAPVESETRYRYTVSDQELDVFQYLRYHVPVADDKFSDSDGHLVVELTTEHPLSLPSSAVDEISAQCLLDAYRDGSSEIESVWSNRVAGLENEKNQIKDFLTESMSDWGLRSENGMLLTGPPGTGKTELVRSACEELYGDIPETISGPEVLSRWVGESEATLRRTFKRAQKSAVPVIYIDEVDAIGASRAASTQDYTAQIVSQLLVLLDGIEAKTGGEADSSSLRVIASTNASDQLDSALKRPGRLGDNVVEFDRPNSNQRYAIFHHYLEIVYANADALNDELDSIVQNNPQALRDALIDGTADYTGADIEHVVRVASRHAMRSDSDLTVKHLLRALEETDDQLPTEKPARTRDKRFELPFLCLNTDIGR